MTGKRKVSHRGSKAKGATGEREVAALLTAWASEAGVGLDLIRNLEQTRGGGHDLVGTEQYGLAIEVKRVEANGLNVWWAQAVRQAEQVGCAPVLAHRRNHQPWRFRVQAWLYPYKYGPLMVDLEAEEFKKWFIAKIVLAE